MTVAQLIALLEKLPDKSVWVLMQCPHDDEPPEVFEVLGALDDGNGAACVLRVD